MRMFALAATLASFIAPLMSSSAWSQSGFQGQRQVQSTSAIAGRMTAMRAGPDNQYPSLGNIRRGSRVDIYGCLRDWSWCDVSYRQDRGWVSGDNLMTDYRGRSQHISSVAPSLRIGVFTFDFGSYWDDHYRQRAFYNDHNRWEQHYFESYQSSWGTRPNRSHWGDRTVSGYAVRSSLMRSGPDYDYPSLRRVRGGSQVDIYGCLRDWSWCDVGYRSDRGWVRQNDLTVDYQGRRQNVTYVAPYLGLGVFSFTFGSYWDDHYRQRPFYSERTRWQKHYDDAYQPSWGPRADTQDNRTGSNNGRSDNGRIQGTEGNTQQIDLNRVQAQQQKQSDELKASQIKQQQQQDEKRQRDNAQANDIRQKQQQDEQSRVQLQQKKLDEAQANDLKQKQQQLEQDKVQLEQKQRNDAQANDLKQKQQQDAQDKVQAEQKKVDEAAANDLKQKQLQLEQDKARADQKKVEDGQVLDIKLKQHQLKQDRVDAKQKRLDEAVAQDNARTQ